MVPQRFQSVSPRVIGPMAFVLLLLRVPLIVTVILIALLSDLVIAGSMREAYRYAIADGGMVADLPLQFLTAGVALALACLAIRFSGEAIIALVSPDLRETPGTVGRMARYLPRACALAVAVATALPLLLLAADPTALSGIHARILAAATAAAFLAIGAATVLFFNGPRVEEEVGNAFAPSFALRAALALVPLVLAIGFVGTVLGAWAPGSGMAHHAVERYPDAAVTRLIAEALALFFTCLSARLATGIVLNLVAPGMAFGGQVARTAHNVLPPLASLSVGIALTVQLALAQSARPEHWHALLDAGPWFWGTAAAYLALAVLASLPVGVRLARFGPTGEPPLDKRWSAAAQRMAALDVRWGWFLVALLIVAAGMFALFSDVGRTAGPQMLGPVAIVLFWGFVVAIFFFPIAYLSHMTRMPLLVIILLAAITFSGFDLNDNHELRNAGLVPPPLGPHATNNYRETLDLGKWLASRQDWEQYDHYPIFLVATEGGGIRAAYYTATVLAALQERCPAFAQHTLLISGVSGGSVGTAVFAALTADHAKNVKAADCNLTGRKPGTLEARARKVLSADLLSPLLGATLFPDSLQRILPVPIAHFDRSRALELAIEKSWADADSHCPTCDPNRMREEVAALYRQSGIRNPVPHMLLNTTEAGTGRSIPFATVRVSSLATPFLAKAQIDDAGPAATKLISLQDRMANDHVPLSTAAMLSARFPYLTPAGRVGDVGHYVDGGYFENSGTWILSGVVQNLIGQRHTYRNPADPALEQAVRHVVFITIVLQSAPCTRDTAFARCKEEGAAGDDDSSWSEVMSPLRALLNTRDKRADYSINDLSAFTALIEQLTGGAGADEPDDGVGCRDTICAVTLRFRNAPRVEVPLTWLLSRRARGAMDAAVDGMEAADVTAPPPPSDIPDLDAENQNRILGSYRRVICVLQARKGATSCKNIP